MTKSKFKLSKKPMALIILLAAMVTGILSVAIPLSMSDGLEKYSGIEREVGNENLDTVGWTGIDRLGRPLGELKYRIELVKPINRGEVGCKEASSLTLSKGDYLTIISRRTFFGIQDQVTVITPCDRRVGSSLEDLYPNLRL